MILTHESGSQEDQFGDEKWRQKISWDYPFKYDRIWQRSLQKEESQKACNIMNTCTNNFFLLRLRK